MHGPLLKVVEEEPQKEVDEDDIGEDRQPAQGISPQETDSCQGCGVQESATARHSYKTGTRMSEPRHWLVIHCCLLGTSFHSFAHSLVIGEFLIGVAHVLHWDHQLAIHIGSSPVRPHSLPANMPSGLKEIEG